MRAGAGATIASSVGHRWSGPLEPVRPRTGDDAAPTVADTYGLALSLVLDADATDDPRSRILAPKGRVLDAPEPSRLHERR